ncbi:DeoR family transcriptional regulator [Hydrogenispora ethanolica]|jgi:DeoR family fructose operon transcriptional repressor|uniref:DeoR family transcriptional regulator n=1 Tax=Hydrogenispora ethanolica TaxID=1082276 RepID=A0A4R1SBS9_HYDET|nr:DeoR/GlpR family DNA-binding transcription regulator [Hydrogenispora ethanolica]TCL77023.1 DeoR family transcriptional regulator [Hydrogenispora ethanolica]
MFGLERKSEIINILERAGKVDVNSLAERFGACKETIRRDLRELEKEGVIKRTHGGAVLNVSTSKTAQVEFPVSVREIQRYEEKLVICKRAAAMIADGDTIFVDNSSTTIYLLRYIPKDIHVCIITNSLKLLLEAVQVHNPNLQFICLGGVFKESNMSFSGTIPQRIAKDYYPSKAFLSCASITEQQMLTDSSAAEVDTKRMMIERSQSVIILADYTKFLRMGQIFLADFSSIDSIITDNKTDLSALDYLKKYKTELIVIK